MTEFTHESFLNDVAKDCQKAALFLIAFSVVMDLIVILNGIFAPFSFFLVFFVPFYFVAKSFKASIHINHERILFKRRLFGKEFNKVRILNRAKYIDLKWVAKSDAGTGTGSKFSLDIDIVTNEIVEQPNIYLSFDLRFNKDTDRGYVTDILHQLHTVTGLPLRFEELAAERFYDIYVSQYGTSAILNPRLVA